MVVVYPPDRADRLPAALRTALAETGGQYLHYHLHGLDAPAGYAGADHLLLAYNGPPQFFLPLVTAYEEFPPLRASLPGTGKVEPAVDSIIAYFGTDFDEGTHLAGQRDDDYSITADKKLATSLAFLIGTGHLDQAAQLIEKIGTARGLSDETQAARAMLDLARNDLDNAIPRLTQLSDSQLQLYLAQGFLRQGNVTSAIAGLVKTIDDSTRQLEHSWYEWLHYYPFDVKVAEKLAGLYEKRLESLDPVKDAGQVGKIEKKLELIRNRAARYGGVLFPG